MGSKRIWKLDEAPGASGDGGLHHHGEVARVGTGDLHAGRAGQTERHITQVVHHKGVRDRPAQVVEAAEVGVVARARVWCRRRQSRVPRRGHRSPAAAAGSSS